MNAAIPIERMSHSLRVVVLPPSPSLIGRGQGRVGQGVFVAKSSTQCDHHFFFEKLSCCVRVPDPDTQTTEGLRTREKKKKGGNK